ncbi:MAG: hypothetical protein FRX49_09739 [Trebouxia sp. A1-2]|nr:MAG: hypothetical protein FRX49_09739 [Trebouxia sp. A1-2]
MLGCNVYQEMSKGDLSIVAAGLRAKELLLQALHHVWREASGKLRAACIWRSVVRGENFWGCCFLRVFSWPSRPVDAQGLAGRLEWAPKLANWGQRGVVCQSGEETGDQGEPAALDWPWLLGLSPSRAAWGEPPGSPELAQLTSLRSAVRTALHAFTVIATAVPPFLINFPPMRLHATTSSDEDAYQAGQEEDVPNTQAALQRQAVDKDTEEPVGADTGHVHPMPLQVAAQPGEPHIHQLLENQLVIVMLNSKQGHYSSRFLTWAGDVLCTFVVAINFAYAA